MRGPFVEVTLLATLLLGCMKGAAVYGNSRLKLEAWAPNMEPFLGITMPLMVCVLDAAASYL